MKEEDRVTVNIGVTANVGDYNSIRVDCGLTLPAGENREETKAKLLAEVIDYAQVALDSAVEAIELPSDR